jgi:hypothetical protein
MTTTENEPGDVLSRAGTSGGTDKFGQFAEWDDDA